MNPDILARVTALEIKAQTFEQHRCGVHSQFDLHSSRLNALEEKNRSRQFDQAINRDWERLTPDWAKATLPAGFEYRPPKSDPNCGRDIPEGIRRMAKAVSDYMDDHFDGEWKLSNLKNGEPIVQGKPKQGGDWRDLTPDPNLGRDIPNEVIEAANLVATYFATQTTGDWEFMGIRNRFPKQGQVDVEKEFMAAQIEKDTQILRWCRDELASSVVAFHETKLSDELKARLKATNPQCGCDQTQPAPTSKVWVGQDTKAPLSFTPINP